MAILQTDDRGRIMGKVFIPDERQEALMSLFVPASIGNIVSKDTFLSNAKRLVACWNACEGISTAALLEIDNLNKANVRLFDIIKQRDELLEALKTAYANMPDGPCATKIRAAIVKAEGGN